MQTFGTNAPSPGGSSTGTQERRPGPGRVPAPLLAGAATAVAAVGALLASVDSASPLRGPCALFFLVMAPATAVATALRGLDPFGRALCALAGAVAVDMLVAQGMLAIHRWSIRGGVVAVTVLSLALLLLSLFRERISAKRVQERTT
ncbi:hypothetical protein ACGFT2_16855 [Streptomyces sp. NPDC048514]|uniref:hypothetical protein n=1 Tax=Streptomyces sp. NPDC048514 TaxID=3365564 RepID=UPI0037171A52